MDEDRSEDCGPPAELDDAFLIEFVSDAIAEARDSAVWGDERFLKWLTDREGEQSTTALSLRGQRLIARAYCRRFGIRLLESPPVIVPLRHQTRNPSMAPMIDLSELGSFSLSSVSRAVLVPAGFERFNCVACNVVQTIECFAPFVDVGDTLLIALSPPRYSPAAIVRESDRRVKVVNDDWSDGLIGALIALWSSVLS
jgi:hypothetical protein